MRNYEAMLLLDPVMESETSEKTINRFTDLIKKHEGKVAKVDEWGKRRLSYPIRGHSDGTYVVIDFEGETKTINELDRILRITDDVMRYIIVRLDHQ